MMFYLINVADVVNMSQPSVFIGGGELRFLSGNLAEAPFDLAETPLGMAGLLGGVHLP